MYERGKALNMATTLELDNVIDPFATRAWIVRGLNSVPPTHPRKGKKRANISSVSIQRLSVAGKCSTDIVLLCSVLQW
jgi:hypothetical protein